MPKMRRKADLPVKTCVTCGQPMVWRKAWEKNWEQVKYCSDRCRSNKGAQPSAPALAATKDFKA